MVKSPFPWQDSTRFRCSRKSHSRGGVRMTLPAAVSASRNEVRTVAPRLIELTETLVYPDIWERPGLSKRDRSLITVAALMAMYRPDQLKGHTERALANGVTKEQIRELVTHLAFYAGSPSALSASTVVTQGFDQEKRGGRAGSSVSAP